MFLLIKCKICNFFNVIFIFNLTLRKIYIKNEKNTPYVRAAMANIFVCL